MTKSHDWNTCANGEWFDEEPHTAAECAATPNGWTRTRRQMRESVQAKATSTLHLMALAVDKPGHAEVRAWAEAARDELARRGLQLPVSS